VRALGAAAPAAALLRAVTCDGASFVPGDIIERSRVRRRRAE